MNKTHIVTELPCGCVERRWLFGRDIDARLGCREHGFGALPPRRSFVWPEPKATGPRGPKADKQNHPAPPPPLGGHR